MTLTDLPALIIAEPNSTQVRIWRQPFRDLPSVTVARMSARQLLSDVTVDAVVFNSWMAHERYGGHFVIGVSQVISTRQEPEMPAWIVTLPPYHSKGYFVRGKDGVQEWVEIKEDHTYESFFQIFSAVHKFNSAGNYLRVLGISTQLLVVHDVKSQARQIKQAYNDVMATLSG